MLKKFFNISILSVLAVFSANISDVICSHNNHVLQSQSIQKLSNDEVSQILQYLPGNDRGFNRLVRSFGVTQDITDNISIEFIKRSDLSTLQLDYQNTSGAYFGSLVNKVKECAQSKINIYFNTFSDLVRFAAVDPKETLKRSIVNLEDKEVHKAILVNLAQSIFNKYKNSDIPGTEGPDILSHLHGKHVNFKDIINVANLSLDTSKIRFCTEYLKFLYNYFSENNDLIDLIGSIKQNVKIIYPHDSMPATVNKQDYINIASTMAGGLLSLYFFISFLHTICLKSSL